jgi:hypothetical protein
MHHTPRKEVKTMTHHGLDEALETIQNHLVNFILAATVNVAHSLPLQQLSIWHTYKHIHAR